MDSESPKNFQIILLLLHRILRLFLFFPCPTSSSNFQQPHIPSHDTSTNKFPVSHSPGFIQ